MKAVRKLARDPVDVEDDAIIYLYSRLPFLAHRSSQILNAAFAARTASLNITVPQYHLLDLLQQAGPSPQIDLARKAAGGAATVGLILRNAIAAGWARRDKDPRDSRRKIVQITDAGRTAVAAAAAADSDVCRKVGEHLAGDSIVLETLLDRVLADAGRQNPGADRDAPPASLGKVSSLMLKLRLFQQFNERCMTDAVGVLGLTARQFTMLYVILAIPGLNRSVLVRITGLEGSNAALVIGLLLGKNLIEPLSRPAGNRARFRISASGATLLAASHLMAMEAEAALTSGLGKEEVIQLQRLLGKVIREFDGDMRQPMPAFVAVQAQRRWPMPVAPAPSLMLRIRDALAA